MSGAEPADPEAQIRQAFSNLAAILNTADATWDDVIHVYAFLQDRPRRQPLLDKVWPEIFPEWGQCPARKAVQYDALNGGSQVVQLQAVAVRGQGPRRDFTLPNVPVHDTGTMGAALGRYLWSSGLAGNPAGRLGSLEEQAEWAFRHLGVLVEQAGGGLDGVGQVTTLVRDYADEPVIKAQWRATFPDAADEPAHHVAAFGLNPLNTERVQLHVAAAF
ncbi:MAG TPA: RidA family protein [Chloroflexota bacterium]